MDKFIIRGGKKLKGDVTVSGAKNASLALMPAALLSNGVNKLYNTPELNDVYTMLKLLSQMGVKYTFNNYLLELDTSNISSYEAPYEHVKKNESFNLCSWSAVISLWLCKSFNARRLCLGSATS